MVRGRTSAKGSFAWRDGMEWVEKKIGLNDILTGVGFLLKTHCTTLHSDNGQFGMSLVTR